MMRVGLDISQIAHTGGVSSYTKNLAKGLSGRSDLETVFFYSSLRKPLKFKLKNVKSFRLPPTVFEVLFNRMRNILIENFIGQVDIFHSSDWVQPPTKAKKVTTYHDVVALIHPEWSHPKVVEVQKRRLKIIEQEIDLVIAVSEATKKDLLQVSKLPADKIVVIHEGVDERFRIQPEEEVRKFRLKYNLPDQFLLSIGGVGDRRNLKRIREAAKDFNLLVTGIDLPIMADEEMPLLYASSYCLVYPSLYEGFGLPILEAQACGVPVITSNISSMPEVANDGAILVDPTSIQEIVEALNKIKDLSVRRQLVKTGLENVKFFSWDKCIEETAAAYMKVLK